VDGLGSLLPALKMKYFSFFYVPALKMKHFSTGSRELSRASLGKLSRASLGTSLTLRVFAVIVASDNLLVATTSHSSSPS